MGLPPLRKPGDAARDPLVERYGRLPAEQPAGAADVGNVPGHLTEQRWSECHVGLLAGCLTDQLCHADERVALTVGEVDRLVPDAPLNQALDAADDSLDAVVDIGEVEHFVVAAEHGDRLAAQDPVGEERDHADHAREVVVVPSVDVGEAEDDVRQLVATGVGVDERLAGDFRRGVRALCVREVGASFLGLEAVDVAVHLAARAEDDRGLRLPAVLEHVERHRHVLERAGRLAHELVHLGVGGEMDDDVSGGVLDAADASFHGRVVPR